VRQCGVRISGSESPRVETIAVRSTDKERLKREIPSSFSSNYTVERSVERANRLVASRFARRIADSRLT